MFPQTQTAPRYENNNKSCDHQGISTSFEDENTTIQDVEEEDLEDSTTELGDDEVLDDELKDLGETETEDGETSLDLQDDLIDTHESMGSGIHEIQEKESANFFTDKG